MVQEDQLVGAELDDSRNWIQKGSGGSHLAPSSSASLPGTRLLNTSGMQTACPQGCGSRSSMLDRVHQLLDSERKNRIEGINDLPTKKHSCGRNCAR